jgi:hypothetical protein
MRRYHKAALFIAPIALAAANGFSHQTAADTPPAQASLLDDIPDSAVAALVIRQNAISPFTQLLLGDADTQAELSDYLDKTVGVDVSRVQGVVGFVTSVDETSPSGAVLFVIPGATTLHRPKLSTKDGIDFYDIGAQPVVAAVGPLGVVLGTQDAVETEIQLEQKKGTPLAASSPLGFMLKSDPQQVDAEIGVSTASLPAMVTAQISQFGVSSLDVSWMHGGTLAAVATGDPAKLTADKSQIDAVLQMATSQLKAQKDTAKAGDDVGAAVGAIIAYHVGQKYLAEIDPTLNGNQLSASLTFPRIDTSGILLPMMMAGAGVALMGRKAEAEPDRAAAIDEVEGMPAMAAPVAAPAQP